MNISGCTCYDPIHGQHNSPKCPVGRLEKLEAAVRKHRDTRGDDRCYEDDNVLYATLPEGYTPPAREVAVQLEHCKQFIACRQSNPATEYVSPQREIERLEVLVAELAEALRTARPPESGPPIWTDRFLRETVDAALARTPAEALARRDRERTVVEAARTFDLTPEALNRLHAALAALAAPAPGGCGVTPDPTQIVEAARAWFATRKGRVPPGGYVIGERAGRAAIEAAHRQIELEREVEEYEAALDASAGGAGKGGAK